MFGRWMVVAAVGVGMASVACTAQVAQPGEQQGGGTSLLDGLGKKDGTTTSSSSSSSSSTSGGPTTQTKQCGITSENATCNSCIQGSCCQAASTCAGNAQCIDLFKCVAQCQDQECSQMCAQQYPSGIDPLNAFGSCINQSCNGKC